MIESATLTLAYFLDLAIGDPRWLPHPVRITGKAITKTENFLRRIIQNTKHRTQPAPLCGLPCFAERGQGARPGNIDNPPTPPIAKGGEGGFEKLAGIFLVLIIVGSTYGLFFVINLLLTSHFSLLTFIFLVYLISTTLATHELLKSAHSVINALKADHIDNARRNLSFIVGRDTTQLSRKDVLKATVETLAENASDGIIAPLFYFSIGGLPLAMAYKAINTLDSMVGYKNEKYKDFGWASARLDDSANYIPARITGILIVISSAIVSRSLFTVHCSLSTMLRDGRNHLSPNSGVPEAAMAGALGIRLGGSSRYGGIIVDKPYIGEKRQMDRTQSTDEIHLEASMKAVTIIKVTSFLGLVSALAILYLRNNL
ncbi:MAG: adenosylcobinamide-phosphate synthase CbiB [Thermodesulfovibrionia bacterium]|nr:adenosylcobinamide-phosphate synthase CbiB [Thermodesulfovibrionia bacterium]